MSDLIEIQNQIAALQKKEQEIKATQRAEVIKDILVKMEAFDISAEDLNRTRTRSRKPGVVKSSNPAPVKYRGTEGETWSGRGLMPRWLKNKIDAGQRKEEFEV